MAILPVGFVKWDGTKYIIVESIDLSGPAGPPGPQGPAGVAAGPASGDLGGNYPNPLVVKLQGRSISSAAPSDGQILTWIASNNDWEPQPAPVGFSAGGDLSGTATNQNVINIHGASVPIAGSLTTGNVLQVTGASALSYGAVNLAGGSNFVTGTLPAGNQASQTLSGDVTGTTAANTVVTLTGSAGTITLPIGNKITSTGTSNVGDIIATSAGVLTLGSGFGGAVVLQSTGSGGYVKINAPTSGTIYLDANTQRIRDGVGNEYFQFDLSSPSLKLDSASGTFPTIGLIRTKANSTIIAGWDGSANRGLLSMDGSGGVVLGGTPGLSDQVGSVTLAAASAFGMYSSTTSSTMWYWTPADYTMTMYRIDAAPTIKQRDLTTNSGTGNAFTIQAQNETGTTSVGGNLVLKSGTGTSTNGDILISPGGTEIGRFKTGTIFTLNSARIEILGTGGGRVDIGDWADSPAFGAIYFSVAPAPGKYAMFGDGTSTYLNTPGAGSLHFSVNNTEIATLNSTTFAFAAATSTPTIKQTTQTSDTATFALTLQAQDAFASATGANRNGGNLVLSSGNFAGAGSAGSIVLNSGSSQRVSINDSGTWTLSANTSFTSSSGNITYTAGGVAILGATTNGVATNFASGFVNLVSPSATGYVSVGSSGQDWLRISGTNGAATSIAWDTAATSVTLKQNDRTTASGTGATLIIQAQNETGTTSIGGNLQLASGSGTSTDGYIGFYPGGYEFARMNHNASTSGWLQLDSSSGTFPAIGIIRFKDYTSVGATYIEGRVGSTDAPIIKVGTLGYDLQIADATNWATTVMGAPLVLQSGSSIQMNLTTGVTSIEATKVGGSNRISALNRGAPLTSTEMPANTGDLITYIGNAATAPTANAVSGGIMYAEAGALKWRGSSSTVTTMGPADPHCHVCGSDFVTEHESPIYGYLSVCLKCLSDHLGEQPWIRRTK